MKNSKKSTVILMLIMTIVLAACGSQGKDQEIESMSRDEEGSLKVAYTNEEFFYMQYGNAFAAMFPNVVLEVIPTESIWNSDDPVTEMKKLVDEQKPDVVSLTEEQYKLLANDGYLYDLETVVKQDQFDIDKMMPGAIELLKTAGGGKLYGLSPSFTSKALYYNKDMFDKHKIPYPTDRMSWEEILQLAERFPTEGTGEEQTYGLVLSGTTAFDLVETMGTAKGLTYVDYDAGELSMNTEEWKTIFETVTNSYKSGKVSIPGGDNASGDGGRSGGMIRRAGGGAISISMGTMNFAAGKAAMTIDQSFLMNMLQMSQRMGGPVKRGTAVSATSAGKGSPLLEIQEINWDLVTIPVDPTNPDVTGALGLESVWSISAASENLGPAWELVKYVNGEQLAKTSSKSSPQLSTRTEFISSEEHNLEAFTVLGPNPINFAQQFPAGFKDEFATLASEEMNLVVSGSKSVADALQVIQTKGQDLLTQKKLDEQ